MDTKFPQAGSVQPFEHPYRSSNLASSFVIFMLMKVVRVLKIELGSVLSTTFKEQQYSVKVNKMLSLVWQFSSIIF